MYSGKLFLWLDSLTKAEKSRLKDFVNSPFFNKNEDPSRFLTIIYDDEERKLTKVKVYQALFPGKNYDARKITDQVYYLTRLVEQFLSLQKFIADPILQNINLLSESLDRSIEKMALSTSSEVEVQLRETTYRDQVYYYQDYLFQTELDKFYIGKEKVKRDESLQKKTDSLDLFYISTKLRDCCEMLNRNQIMQSSYEMPMLINIKGYVEEFLYDFGKYPAIGIYYHILLMLQNPEKEVHFQELTSLLEINHALFPENELQDMYNYARNYCIRKINAGDNEYYRPLFEISKKLIDTGLIQSGKYITQRDYKNIVSNALRIGEFDWTLAFINDYKLKISPENRQNAYAYNLANYYYETKDYTKSVRLLRDVEFTDVYYNLGAKTMLLKIYFERDEDELFLAMAAAFKIYLTRNKLINEQTYLNYNNLLSYTRKAFYLKNRLPYQRKKDFGKKVVELITKVENTKNIVNKKWLAGQIKKLES
jgi:hypothetical protein